VAPLPRRTEDSTSGPICGSSGPPSRTDALDGAARGEVFPAAALVLAVALGACGPGGPTYDLSAGVPRFVHQDVTQLAKVERLSMFRSSYGHDYSDGAERMRSMKHYFVLYPAHWQNGEVEIRAPVEGDVVALVDERHGAGGGLVNRQVHLRATEQPAFTFVLFHVDLASADVAVGRHVAAGELLGHARLVFADPGDVSNNFDVAVWVRTPGGSRLVSFVETLADDAFAAYQARGAAARSDFVISREERDAHPLTAESFRDPSLDPLPRFRMLDPT
jgi:hypothetical protein